jgi:ribosomal protein S17E
MKIYKDNFLNNDFEKNKNTFEDVLKEKSRV